MSNVGNAENDLVRVDVSTQPARLTIVEPSVLTEHGGNVSTVLYNNEGRPEVVDTVTEEYDYGDVKDVKDELVEKIKRIREGKDQAHEAEDIFDVGTELTIDYGNDKDDYEEPEIMVNTIHANKFDPEDAVPLINKDSFSASSAIAEASSQIDETIARIGMNAKALVDEKQKNKKYKKSEKLNIIKTTVGKNKANILPKNKKQIEAIKKSAEYARLLQEQQIAKQMKRKHFVKPAATTTILKARAKKRKAVTVTPSKKTKLIASALASTSSIKKKQQLQKQKQEKEKREREQQQQSMEARLQRLERNRPEILVTKPLPEDSPYFENVGEPSTYKAKGKLWRKSTKKALSASEKKPYRRKKSKSSKEKKDKKEDED